MSTPALSRDASALVAGPLAWTEDLTVRFGRRTVLDRVTIAVQPGEVVTLIGPNGAGKTTLVRAVLGLVEVMKQFSELTAEVAGTLVAFHVDDGDPVEPGQLLAVIQSDD